MKRLYLLRHAKSSWDDVSLADFDRPLNDRGLRAAPFMGRSMAERGIRPDTVVSSPARRAAQTAELVREAAGWDVPVNLDSRIYEASPQTLLHIISELPDDSRSAVLVGHNPGMAAMVAVLTGADESMPTGALASIKLNVEDWAQIGPETGELEFLLRPKEEMKNAGARPGQN
jgi:phosphohistidine phosphatase